MGEISDYRRGFEAGQRKAWAQQRKENGRIMIEEHFTLVKSDNRSAGGSQNHYIADDFDFSINMISMNKIEGKKPPKRITVQVFR
jgi:hypothetical protein